MHHTAATSLIATQLLSWARVNDAKWLAGRPLGNKGLGNFDLPPVHAKTRFDSNPRKVRIVGTISSSWIPLMCLYLVLLLSSLWLRRLTLAENSLFARLPPGGLRTTTALPPQRQCKRMIPDTLLCLCAGLPGNPWQIESQVILRRSFFICPVLVHFFPRMKTNVAIHLSSLRFT